MSDEFQIYPYRRLSDDFADFAPASKNERKKQKLPKINLKILSEGLNLESFFFMGVGLLLCNSYILGGISPFGLAFFAAAIAHYRRYLGPMLFALISGQALFNQGPGMIINMLVLVLYALWQFFFPIDFTKRWLVLPLAVFLVSVPIKLGWALFHSAVVYQIVALLVEGILAAGLAIVYLACLQILQARKIPHGLSNEELVCAVIFCLSIGAGLMDFTFRELSVGHIFSCHVIMLAALIGGGGAGAALGSVLGILPSLVEIKAPTLLGIYGFAGMLAGAMNHWHKVGVSAGFLLGNLMLSIYLLEPQAVTAAFMEALLAVLLLCLTPNRIINRLRTVPALNAKRMAAQGGDPGRYGELVGLRLTELARAFEELSAVLREQGTAEEPKEEEVQSLFNTIARVVCEGCSLFAVCWENDFCNTYKNILKALAQAEHQQNLTSESLPHELARRCVRGRELATTLNCLYDMYRVDRFWRQKMDQYQGLLAVQYNGLSQVLRSTAQSLSDEGYFHQDLEANISDLLDKAGYNPEKVLVWQEAKAPGLEINLSLSPCADGQRCERSIEPLVSSLVGQPLMVERKCCGEQGLAGCEVRLQGAPALAVETGVAQQAPPSQEICGDSFAVFNLPGGKLALVLSDGMGVGIRAAKESKRAVALLERLLTTGLKPLVAAQMLNSLLLFRGEEETFTTVDLAIIDRHTGETEFIKIGSAPSYIIREDKIWSVVNRTPPAGIISNLPLESTTQVLQPGDILVMLTDGILEADRNAAHQEEWLKNILRYSLQGTPEQMAQQVLEMVKTTAKNKQLDDLSVLVAQVTWEH